MADLTQIAAALLGEQSQELIAKENPYYQFVAPAQAFSQGALNAQTTGENPRAEMWNKAIAASLGGLLGGGLQGLGNNYQNVLTDRYQRALGASLLGQEPSAEGLPPGLFGAAKRGGTLFKAVRGAGNLELADKANAEVELQDRLIDVAARKRIEEIYAEDEAYRNTRGAPAGAAPTKVVKPGLLPVATGADGTTVVAEVPVVEDAAPPPSAALALPEGNPNNPYYKDELEKTKYLRDQILKLEGDTYSRIKGLPSATQFADIDANFRTLQALSKQDSRPASVGMIASLARIWDPMGTVREGEYALNAQAQSALDSLVGDWREIVMGKGRLSIGAKKAIITAAAQKYNEFGAKYAAEQSDLYNALKSQGGNPANVPTSKYSPFDVNTLDQLLMGGDEATQVALLKAQGFSKQEVIQLMKERTSGAGK